MKRASVVVTAGLLAVSAPLAAWAAGSPSGTPACRVVYNVAQQWPGGFLGQVRITNGGAAIKDWNLAFTFPSGTQKVVIGWNGGFTQSGKAVTVKNAFWNGSLTTEGSVDMGFVGAWSGSNQQPASFTLNGVTCNETTPAPAAAPSTSTPTTPAPTTTTPTTTAPAPDPSTSTPTTPTTSTTTPAPATAVKAQSAAGSAPSLKVSGNELVTASGQPYRLLGVNRSGGEFACIQGNGFWDGPMDAASVDVMRSWKIRTVRVPLNEECWLGTADVKSQYGGTAYQNAVKTYVNLLVSKGITPIVEMHWNYGKYTGNSAGCSDVKATCQKPMPDAQYAPQFWMGVAEAFKGNDAVVLDLFNEPYPERATGDVTSGWKCFRDGGVCAGIPYQVAGFQLLVDAVRKTGATNVILVGGLAYSNDLGEWLTYRPKDPLNNLAAFAHIYNFNTCSTSTCWDSTFGKVAEQVPLTISEIGENTCGHSFVDKLYNWADTKGIGYLGWAWNTWDCSSGPSLISNYDGTATVFGQGLKAALAKASN
ncbi:MAG TPA: cellulose binding domain-containing protein [Kineosporiaceae bacterium]|nr:cellulose binding domain-containing protein [Kineosporiaceae bacterium]